jgi:hypothetical protein
MIDKKLWEIGFQQHQMHECVFYHDDIMLIMYVDDRQFFSNDDDTLMLIIKQLKGSGLNIKIKAIQLTMLESTSRRHEMD